MKLMHSIDWHMHHQGTDTLQGIENIVRKAFERAHSITKKTEVKILTGIHTSEMEPAHHVLVEIDRGFGCIEEAYVYVVPEGCGSWGWDGSPPLPVRIANVPSALMKIAG